MQRRLVDVLRSAEQGSETSDLVLRRFWGSSRESSFARRTSGAMGQVIDLAVVARDRNVTRS